jgi:IclR family acetate operon transcriptional repressor
MREPERDYGIVVLTRALDLLDSLASATEPLGATELARRLGTTKSATFRILVNLERRGYVRKDPGTARYLLGPRLVTLGHRARGDFDLLRVAHPHLAALSGQFQETANLGVLEQRDVIYLDIVESPRALRMAARVGARDRAHSTALGKAILAFLPEPEREQLLRAPLEARTARTIIDPALLRAELDAIRQSGIAVEFGENEPDARCLGAPVFDHHGTVCAAISISGPASRIDDTTLVVIGSAVADVARTLTVELGGVWPLNAVVEPAASMPAGNEDPVP